MTFRMNESWTLNVQLEKTALHPTQKIRKPKQDRHDKNITNKIIHISKRLAFKDHVTVTKVLAKVDEKLGQENSRDSEKEVEPHKP